MRCLPRASTLQVRARRDQLITQGWRLGGGQEATAATKAEPDGRGAPGLDAKKQRDITETTSVAVYILTRASKCERPNNI